MVFLSHIMVVSTFGMEWFKTRDVSDDKYNPQVRRFVYLDLLCVNIFIVELRCQQSRDETGSYEGSVKG